MSQLNKNYNILLRPVTSVGSLFQCFAQPHSKQMFPSAQADCPLVQLYALFPFCHWFPGAEFSTSLFFPPQDIAEQWGQLLASFSPDCQLSLCPDPWVIWDLVTFLSPHDMVISTWMRAGRCGSVDPVISLSINCYGQLHPKILPKNGRVVLFLPFVVSLNHFTDSHQYAGSAILWLHISFHCYKRKHSSQNAKD